MPAAKTHHHVFRFSYSSGKRLSFRCLFCEELRTREATSAEFKLLTQRGKHGDVHKVWHSFLALRKKHDDLDSYGLFLAVEKWAAKQPKGHVHFVGCDDSHHMSSDIVIIEHKADDYYMGASVVYFPQNNDTSQFFLYPHHQVALEQKLKELRLVAAPIRRLQQKKEKDYFRAIAKWKP